MTRVFAGSNITCAHSDDRARHICGMCNDIALRIHMYRRASEFHNSLFLSSYHVVQYYGLQLDSNFGSVASPESGRSVPGVQTRGSRLANNIPQYCWNERADVSRFCFLSFIMLAVTLRSSNTGGLATIHMYKP